MGLATEDDLKAYRAYLAEQYARATVTHRLAAVRRFYEAAIWRGYRADNPAAGIRPPRERTAREERVKFLPLEGLKRLLDAPVHPRRGARDRAMLALMERTRRALRLKVPEGNDVTDFWKAGGDLRAWVLAGLEEHAPDPMRDVLDDPLVQAAIALGGVVTQVLNV